MKYPSVKKVIDRWAKYFDYGGPKVQPIEIVKDKIFVNKKYKEVFLDNRN